MDRVWKPVGEDYSTPLPCCKYSFVMTGATKKRASLLRRSFLSKLLDKLPRAISHIYCALLFVYGWVIFALEDTTAIGAYTKALFGVGGAFDRESLYLLASFAILFVLGIIGATPLFSRLFKVLEKKSTTLSFALSAFLMIAGFLLSLVYITASSYNPFLYFRF